MADSLLLEGGGTLLLEGGGSLLLEGGGPVVATVGKVPTKGFTAGAIKYVVLKGFESATAAPTILTPTPSILTWGNPDVTLNTATIFTIDPDVLTWGNPSVTLNGGIRLGGQASYTGLPFNRYTAIVLSDSVNIPGGITDAIYVGAGGDVVLIEQDGLARTLVAVPTGTVVPVKAIRVNSTGTSASSLIALNRV